MSGSVSTSSNSNNHITTSDTWSAESSSSHVSGKASGSGSRKSVTMAQLGAVMLDQLGYSLEVRTSGDHPLLCGSVTGNLHGSTANRMAAHICGAVEDSNQGHPQCRADSQYGRDSNRL